MKLTGNNYWPTTDDLVMFWRSKVKVTTGHRGSESIRVDAGASKSRLLFSSVLSVSVSD